MSIIKDNVINKWSTDAKSTSLGYGKIMLYPSLKEKRWSIDLGQYEGKTIVSLYSIGGTCLMRQSYFNCNRLVIDVKSLNYKGVGLLEIQTDTVSIIKRVSIV